MMLIPSSASPVYIYIWDPIIVTTLPADALVPNGTGAPEVYTVSFQISTTIMISNQIAETQ